MLQFWEAKISFLFSVFLFVCEVHGYDRQLVFAPKIISFENSSHLKTVGKA